MWSDLNMHDRHKLIRLAVTNGVYDLDTIRSLYDNTQNTYSDGGDLQTEPNRTLPPVDKTIEMVKMKALEKALIEQSQNIPNVMPVNDAIVYNYTKPYVTPQPEIFNLTNVLNTPVVHPMPRKPGISLNTDGYCYGGKIRH